MTTTHLLISLGTTICIGIFLYFYLKKRTEKDREKGKSYVSINPRA